MKEQKEWVQNSEPAIQCDKTDSKSKRFTELNSMATLLEMVVLWHSLLQDFCMMICAQLKG